jgi:4-amino-4-deoxy-L-arabinose transferase-like glycosyltransferase
MATALARQHRDSDVEFSGAHAPPISWPAVTLIAGAFAGLELALSARYGFHRDELYFLACARHLSWGYVDQPPFVPTVAWLSTHLLGTSPTALRTLPALAGAGTVVLTGAMARELGGGRRAQTLAAVAAATSAQVMAAFHLLSTTPFDMLFWAAISLVVLRILRTGDTRLWLGVGALGGIGLLNKWNVGVLLAGVVAGVILGGRRKLLANRWALGGATLALALFLPNVIWNAIHDWAGLAMLQALHRENSTLGASLEFLPSQVVVVGPALVLLWLVGLRRMLAQPSTRPLGVTFLVVAAFFTATGAKSYYLAGAYFSLFAAGAVWAEARLRAKGKNLRGWLALMSAGAVIALPLTLPVLPEADLATTSWEGNINKDLSATVGWPQFVRQVAGLADRLPSGQRRDLVVFTGDYGAAGAIDLFGPAYGLPTAISGHNSFWWWGPVGARDGATTIAVNLPRSYLLTIFSSVRPLGRVSTANNVWSEERGDPIWLCTGQTVPWSVAWARARHYD